MIKQLNLTAHTKCKHRTRFIFITLNTNIYYKVSHLLPVLLHLTNTCLSCFSYLFMYTKYQYEYYRALCTTCHSNIFDRTEHASWRHPTTPRPRKRPKTPEVLRKLPISKRAEIRNLNFAPSVKILKIYLTADVLHCRQMINFFLSLGDKKTRVIQIFIYGNLIIC